jgi:hypothetical protein
MSNPVPPQLYPGLEPVQAAAWGVSRATADKLCLHTGMAVLA